MALTLLPPSDPSRRDRAVARKLARHHKRMLRLFFGRKTRVGFKVVQPWEDAFTIALERLAERNR